MKLIPRNYYNNYLDDFFDGFDIQEENAMKCDIYEKKGAYYIEMDIPGYRKEDIKIEAIKGNIVVTATRENQNKEEGRHYIRQERSYGKIQRSFYLGNINDNNIEATFKDGTLKKEVPKEEEKSNKKFIKVK